MTTLYAIAGFYLAIGFLLASAFATDNPSWFTFSQRVWPFLMVMLFWPVFFFLQEAD